MPSVKFSPTETMKKYHGMDGEEIVLFINEGVYSLSADKAKQLLEDFPKNFSKASEKDAKESGAELDKANAKIIRGNKKAGSDAEALENAEKAVSKAEGILKNARAELDAAKGKKRGPATVRANRAEKEYKKLADERDKLMVSILAG